MREVSRVVPLFLLAALTAGGEGCARSPRIEIHGPEARLSSMFGGTCAIFLEIVNSGEGADVLVDAAVDLPGAIVELHDVKDGRMVRTDKVAVPAKGAVTLKPGGIHVMVFNLPKDARAGTELTLRLRFETSGERRTSVRIHG
jgi:copper(I)-binding protein